MNIDQTLGRKHIRESRAKHSIPAPLQSRRLFGRFALCDVEGPMPTYRFSSAPSAHIFERSEQICGE